MKSIKEIKNFKGKKVLLRVGFDVPVKNGKVQNDRRIRLIVPTIEYLAKRAPLIILAYQGRPHGKRIETLSLKYLIPTLEKLLKKKIKFIDSCIGPEVEKIAQGLKKGEILLLENVRFYPEEEKNDKNFAKKLAKLADIYVNDAFPGSHRKHASIVGIPKYLPSYAGFQLEKEVKFLSKVFTNPKHPFLFVLAGAKFETKLPLIRKYIHIADNIFIGGALLNQFLKVQGYNTGISYVSEKDYGIEKIYKNKKIILPSQIIVKNDKGKWIEKKVTEMANGDNQVELAENMINIIAPHIKKAKLILWNGPFNKYESEIGDFSKKFTKLLLQSKAEVIVGGGDTLAAISNLKIEDKFSFVSTGGGATLEFLAKRTLPGIKALE